VTVIGYPLTQIERARQVAIILRQEQEPFWLTGGAIALSNLSLTPPGEAKRWYPNRVAPVFVRGTEVRFSIDARTGQIIRATAFPLLLDKHELQAAQAADILACLISSTPAYQQLVETFSSLAGLEEEALRKAQQQEAWRKHEEAYRTHFDSRQGHQCSPGPRTPRKRLGRY
jgi:hypothetical protein